MTDGYALLRAIEAAPDDDLPRLAYADWLEEHAASDADRARAEFIRLQCARTGPAGASDPTPAETVLQSKFEGVWVRQLPGHLFWPQFRRGFIDPVHTGGFNLVRHWEAIAAVAPLHHVRLFKTPLMTDEIAACPVLRHVRRLDLTSNVIRVAHTQVLMTSPHLTNLRAVNFTSNHVGVGGCRALAAADLPALETLVLDQNLIGDRGLTALLGAPWLPRLRKLSVDRCGLRGPGVANLARSPALAGLRVLDISGTHATQPETLAMLADGAFAGLEVLRLYDCQVTDEVVERLAASPVLANLRELDIAPRSGERAVRGILDSPYLRKLERLRMNNLDTPPAARRMLEARFGAELNHRVPADWWQ
jgi:uncharacterized protein (TIGR02996 family)